MKTYPRDIIKKAAQMIEKNPGRFSTNVADNIKILKKVFHSRLKQKKEKEVDTLASAIALLLEGKRRRELGVKGLRTERRKKTKHRLKRRLGKKHVRR